MKKKTKKKLKQLCLSLFFIVCGMITYQATNLKGLEQENAVEEKVTEGNITVGNAVEENAAGEKATEGYATEENISDESIIFDLSMVPEFDDRPYSIINNNVPFFSEKDKVRTDAFEIYSELDNLGRCGLAYVNVCSELQPTEKRGEIGSVKPSGWIQAKYPGIIPENPPYLFNRCHLIGYQLAGENANRKNLITGTRYLNVSGMLPFENQVDEYVDATENHVLYRVTPIFEGDNMVASGVLMEAYSVEDTGKGIQFCAYCYNVQPGIEIDYATGASWER